MKARINSTLNTATLSSIVVLTNLGLASNVNADTLFGLYAEVDYWSALLDGDFGNGDSNGFFKSFAGDSGERDQHGIFSFQFEHGIPILPNVWIRLNNITYSNSQSLSNNVNVGSASFNTSSPVLYNFDFTHTDAALYYELMDNWLSLDLGFGVKNLQFDYRINQGSESYTFDETGTIPMLYGKASIELPFTGWQFTAQAMALSFEEQRIDDINLKLGYNFTSSFQVALGYREIKIDINHPTLQESVLSLSGSYLSFIAHL